MQSADHAGSTRVGWGGRIADRLDAANPGTLFPPLISIDGRCRRSCPAIVGPADRARAIRTSRSTAAARATTSTTRCATPRCARSWRRSRRNIYDMVAQLLSEEGLAASSVVRRSCRARTRSSRRSSRASTTDRSAVRTIAQLIEGRAQTQHEAAGVLRRTSGATTRTVARRAHTRHCWPNFAAGIKCLPGRDGRARAWPTA